LGSSIAFRWSNIDAVVWVAVVRGDELDTAGGDPGGGGGKNALRQRVDSDTVTPQENKVHSAVRT